MIQQIKYLVLGILCLPLLPFLFLLGKRVRTNMPDLPESPGPFKGMIGNSDRVTKLLCLGESSVAGVGIDNHANGFTGQIALNLSKITGHAVQWEVIAKSGYTAKRAARELVPQIQTEPQDLIVIGLGGNDTFQLNSPLTWKKSMIGLIGAIRKRQPSATIVIANLPPVADFPAFPWPIQFVFGSLINWHHTLAQQVPHHFQSVYFLKRRINLNNWHHQLSVGVAFNDLFTDGVHPSKLTYAIWGKEIAQTITHEGMLTN